MAVQLKVATTLQVLQGNIPYQTQRAWSPNMIGTKGPTPGSILVPTHGVEVSLSEIDIPGGLCQILNCGQFQVVGDLDPTHFVTYGIMDSLTNRFFPIHEVLPGESYVSRLSRFLGDDYGTGSGSSSPSSGDKLWFKANKVPCVVIIDAFDA